MKGGLTLKINDDRIMAALLVNSSVRAAAAAVPCSENTIYGRMRDPAFKSRLLETQAAALASTASRISECTGQAVAVLQEVMNDDLAAPAVRAQAAQSILREAVRLYTLTNFEARLAALEAKNEY